MTPNKEKTQYDTVVVAPYFEDIACDQFIEDIAQNMDDKDYLVIVDDGSIDRPFAPDIIKDNKLNGVVLKLSHNVGHQTAIACGLSDIVERLSFKRIVIMDSDGEDRPAAIKELVDFLEKNDQCDIVVASRKSRVESIRFKAFYWIYQMVFKLFVGRSIRYGNFMALSPRAASRLVRLNETAMHIAATTMKSRLNVRELSIDRGSRYAGNSKMNFVSLTLHGLRSIMVFAEVVLVRITLFCAAAASVIIVAIVIMIILKLTGLAIPGWFSTVGGILLLLLLQIGLVTLLVLLSAGDLHINRMSPNHFKKLVASRYEV